MKEILCWVLVSLAGKVSCVSRCLDSVEIVEISGSEAQLSWTYSCDKGSLDRYKVHFTHNKYLACADGSRDDSRPSGIGTEEVEDTRVIIHNLHPHSEYEFEVVAVTTNSEKPEFLKTVADTLEAAPEVRALPRQSADSSTHSKMAVFDWTRPAESQCSLYNSHLGGWAYKVVGMDDWNKQFMIQGNLPISQTHLEVENLAPYSHYLLLLYTANQAGLYDENVVLKIPVTTAQSSPAAPSQLQAVQASPGSVMLNWETVFPPLGRLTQSWSVQSSPSLVWCYSQDEGHIASTLPPQFFAKELIFVATILCNGQNVTLIHD